MSYPQYRFAFGSGLPPVIKKLMIIMGAVFLLQTAVEYHINFFLGLVPLLVWKKYYLWQLFTYLFLHGDVSHILFNLLALWMFGGELENLWGSKKIPVLFFLLRHRRGDLHGHLFPLPVHPCHRSLRSDLRNSPGLWVALSQSAHLYLLSLSDPGQIFCHPLWLHRVHLFLKGRDRAGAWLTSPTWAVFSLASSYMAYPVVRQKIRREYYKRKWSQKGPDSGGYYH